MTLGNGNDLTVVRDDEWYRTEGRIPFGTDPSPSPVGRSEQPPSLSFDWALTDAQRTQARGLMWAAVTEDASGRIDITERLGGYLVEPGGVVCADWAGVLAAIRRTWGVA